MTATSVPAGPVIEVHGLTKHFGAVAAVSDLDFTVRPGRVTGFLGPNGAGKTTTLRVLLGLVNPSAGTATIHGRRYRDLEDPAGQVGAVLEATSFHPTRRARAHLEMMALAGGFSSARVDEVLGLVGLSEVAGRRVGGFSLGMRQRLELAGALLGDPDVLILDEPSNGLDPQGIAWLRDLLGYLAGQGRTVLVSSHQLAEVAQMVHDVVIVAQGRLVSQSPLSALTQKMRPRLKIRSPEALRLAWALHDAGWGSHPVSPDTIVVEGGVPEAIGPIVAANQVVIYEMVHETSDLESVFLSLTTGAEGIGSPPPSATGGLGTPGRGVPPTTVTP